MRNEDVTRTPSPRADEAGDVRSRRHRDLDTPEQIAEMVRRFYREVAQDDLLGPLFNDVAQVDWSDHLPKLTRFWCRALLGSEGYEGNPLEAHAWISARSPFTAGHFVRWSEIFDETVESGWAGPHAGRALALAHNVAAAHSRHLVGATVPTPGTRQPIPVSG